MSAPFNRGQWRSGLLRNPISDFWGPTLTARNPQIPNLPLETPSAGGVTGTGAITLDVVTVAGAGQRGAVGTGAIALATFTVSGIGTRGVVGTGALTLDPITVSGAGQRGSAGAGAIALDPITVAGAGQRGILAAGAITLDPITVAGAGGIAAPVTGDGAIGLPEIVVSGSGARGVEAAGAITLEAVLVSGDAARSISGGGAILLAEFRVVGYEAITTAYFLNGTAYDQQGRMITLYLDPAEPLPPGAKMIEGFAHNDSGFRYVTSWPGTAKLLGGFAIRDDGVQIVAADAVVVSSIHGLGVTARGEISATLIAALNRVDGQGIDGAARTCVSNPGA